MKKKKIIKIVGVVTGLIIVCVGLLAAFQYKNIVSLYNSMKYSNEELSGQIAESKKEVKVALEKYDIYDLSDIAPESEEEILKGKVSSKTAVEEYLKNNNGSGVTSLDEVLKQTSSAEALSESREKEKQQARQNAQTPDTEKSEASNSKEKEIIKSNVTKLYALKAYYLGEISNTIGKMKREYNSLPANQKNGSAKQRIAMSYLSEIDSLESSCDSRVNNIISNLESELKAVGGDLSIISTIRQTYEKEKSLKKSYYINAYK